MARLRSYTTAAYSSAKRERPGPGMPSSYLPVVVSGRGGGSRYSASSTSTSPCPRWRSSSRSPYAVLNVTSNANMDDIKASFRKRAKRHHPDLRMHRRDDDDDGESRGDGIMTDLIAAYESLINGHEGLQSNCPGGNSRVALACQSYTLDELRGMRRIFDVHSFRIEFVNRSNCPMKSENVQDANVVDGVDRHVRHYSRYLDPFPIVPLKVHSDDSISDLKRHIQNQYAEDWGLGIIDRRVDRDGLYLGWELVYGTNDEEECGNGKGCGSVLSYHLFLSSYGIREGDLLHAVVGRNIAE